MSAVEVRVDGSSVHAELQTIPAELASRFGIDDSFKFFIAFLPNSAVDSVEIRGLDTTDQDVATRTLTLPGANGLEAGAQLQHGLDGR
ncbi:MAG TPA: hypothetical protein VFI17_09840 [Solirubrobacterales bacterium]|nr:hypothetical protein [Solirubrobacterales bacterium]